MTRLRSQGHVVLSALLALGLFLPSHANGQGATSATVQGTVTDASGAAIPSATVQVKNTGTGKTQTAPTDAQGRYTIVDLAIGTYDVQAAANGFQTAVRQGVLLTVGAQTVVDFAMTVGQAQQTVNVEGAVSQVDTVSSTVSANVEQKQIGDLPLNGRNFTDLIALVPGVAAGSQIGNGGFNLLYGVESNFSVSGARSEGQAFLLDNQDIQGFWAHGSGSGVLGTTLGIEAIAEFSVLTNTYSAQFGGNGAAVNTASKSGTNQFHGSAYEFLRNSALDARNFFDNFVAPGQTASKIPAYRQNQFGGSFGGPIKKDKLFFFANDEELRKVQGVTAQAFIPDANLHNGLVESLAGGVCTTTKTPISPLAAPILALYPATSQISPNCSNALEVPEEDSNNGNENYLLGRVDYTVSEKDSIFFRYVRDYANAVYPFLGSSLPPRWPEVGETRNQFATIEWRRVISPTLVNLARFSFTRTRETDNQQTPDSEPALSFNPATTQNGNVAITGLTTIGSSIFAPLLEVQNKFPFADDVFWTHGKHSLKFGGLISRVQSNFQQDGWWGGSYTFTSIPGFLAAQPFLYIGPIPPYTDSYRDFREIEADFYIHDEWKVLPTLTLNAGVRYEFVTNPVTALHQLNAILNPPFGTFQPVSHVFASNPATRNWDPRVGLAWDPFKNHKTSIRVGAGIFYDPIRARTYASGYYFNKPYELAFEIFPSFPNPFSTGYNTPSEIVGIDYNVPASPHMYQWNFNIQHQLFEATTLTVGYVGSRGLHLYANRDINPVEPRLINGVETFGALGSNGLTAGFARENPAAGSLGSAGPVADSHYNSLQVGLNRRFARGFQSQLSYTWSKCIDNASGTSGLEGAINWSDPVDGAYDKGRCQFDLNQVFKLSGVYALPFKGNLFVSGWQLNGNLALQSGLPWNPLLGFDQAGNGASSSERPNIISGVNPIIGNVNEWGNPAAFGVPAPGTLGDLQRNYLSGPGLKDFDFSVIKDTRLREQLRLQFRAEFFNIFNHPNFGLPSTGAFAQGPNGTGIPNGSTFGVITTTSTTSRQIQLALKILF